MKQFIIETDDKWDAETLNAFINAALFQLTFRQRVMVMDYIKIKPDLAGSPSVETRVEAEVVL